MLCLNACERDDGVHVDNHHLEGKVHGVRYPCQHFEKASGKAGILSPAGSVCERKSWMLPAGCDGMKVFDYNWLDLIAAVLGAAAGWLARGQRRE